MGPTAPGSTPTSRLSSQPRAGSPSSFRWHSSSSLASWAAGSLHLSYLPNLPPTPASRVFLCPTQGQANPSFEEKALARQVLTDAALTVPRPPARSQGMEVNLKGTTCRFSAPLTTSFSAKTDSDFPRSCGQGRQGWNANSHLLPTCSLPNLSVRADPQCCSGDVG